MLIYGVAGIFVILENLRSGTTIGRENAWLRFLTTYERGAQPVKFWLIIFGQAIFCLFALVFGLVAFLGVLR